MLEFASDVGIKTVTVDTIQPPEILTEVDYETALNRVVKTWKQCAKEAAEKGCRIAWEFEPVYAFNKPSDVVRIVEEIDEDNFGIAFDTGHAEIIAGAGAGQHGKKEILPGGCLEFAQKLRGKINHVHLIDSSGTIHDDGASSSRAFGEGRLDFDKIIPELNRSPVPHEWWVIDLGIWADAWPVVERCKKAVDKYNQTYGDQ